MGSAKSSKHRDGEVTPSLYYYENLFVPDILKMWNQYTVFLERSRLI